MALKFVVLAGFVACARAGAIGPIAYSTGAFHAAPAVAYSAGPALHAAPVTYEAHATPIAYKSYAAAAPVAVAAPITKAVVTKTVDAEFDPNPQYSYAYDVNDALTGDSKTQEEQRDGDVVRGSYSLVEADGTRRIVQYTADPHNGFNAVVHKQPAQVAVKAVAAAPLVAAAPVVKATYAAPALAYKSHTEYY